MGTRNCLVCGKSFSPHVAGKPQIYCSVQCRTKSKERNRNATSYTDACVICGEAFRATHGTRPQRYCGNACKTAGWRRSHATVITCDHCGKTVRRAPTGVSHAVNNHFCSQTCKGKWMSEHLRGENHPRWQGDGRASLFHYVRTSRPFKTWAAKVLANAHGLCNRCGRPAEQAHHKREVAELLALILDPTNGEALCANCHIAHHSG